MNFYFLGELFCWHAILPDLSRPLRRALRSDPLVVCVRVLDSTGNNYVYSLREDPRLEEIILVEYALRLILTCGNELCSALGGWLESASFVCVAVSAV